MPVSSGTPITPSRSAKTTERVTAGMPRIWPTSLPHRLLVSMRRYAGARARTSSSRRGSMSAVSAARKDGRVYSNKAPGATLVALPGYLLARPFSGPPSPSSMRPVLWAMRLFGATLPAGCLALVLFHAAVRFGASPPRAASAAFALLFATPLFAYGLLLFSHALVAACLFGGWVALFFPGDPSRSFRRDCAAGALLGLAVISEYPAAVPAGVLVLCAVIPAPRRLLTLVAGGAPLAALLGAYDLACFGGVFEVSSAHERAPLFRSLASAGLFGISLPSPEIALRLLADPSKGLLVFSPFLLLC